jgi:hypothetical protein
MSKITAVDWLIQQLENHNGVTRAGFEKCIQQAKAMEKNQIIKTYRDGRSDQQSQKEARFYNRNAEYYYNEQYGGNNES